jgi:uncharacterized membrane protein
MEVLVFLFFLVLIVLFVVLNTGLSKKIDHLEDEIFRLRQDLADRKEVATGAPGKSAPAEPAKGGAAPTPGPTPEPKPGPKPLAPGSMETEPFKPAPRPIYRPETNQPLQPAASGPTIEGPKREGSQATDPRNAPHVYQKPGFYDRHPDLEKFIGENLISKIGIGILVLAIGFFVKYAIDNDWIGPAGRVGIGLLCGGILVTIAHLMRNNYKAFSSVLVGGGLAVFYFSIALAYHPYHLFGQSDATNQTVAFVIMLVITLFAVVLSMLYDRQELAIIAMAGGFITPLLVSNGSSNYQVLFTYLLILNTGLLVIAYYKAWRLLNLLAFVFTAILFTSWVVLLPDNTKYATYGGGFLFATAFYILFFLINIAYTVRQQKKFVASDFGILLANTCLYFGAGLYLIIQMNLNRLEGSFSAAMAVFNLVASYFLFRKKKVDSNILYLLIGITLTFVSITAPIQLHGHYITLFWASESVLLYWLSRRSGIRIIGAASLLVSGAMVVSLVMDWETIYFVNSESLQIIFNRGFITGIYAGICCLIVYRMRKQAVKAAMAATIAEATARGMTDGKVAADPSQNYFGPRTFALAGMVVLFAAGALEIGYQFRYHYPNTDLIILYELLYSYAFIFFFTVIREKIRKQAAGPVDAVALSFILIVYLMAIAETAQIQSDMLELHRNYPHFAAHWAGDILVALSFARLIAIRKKRRFATDAVTFAWLTGIFLVVFLSFEIQLLMNALFYPQHYSLDAIQRVYVKTGLPILWGLCSFLFMWLGMRFKFKPLRILSLVLFSVTLLKLFLYDIQDIPIAGKIAAFFCLGILLLVVSFMYQRLKKIIIEDEKKPV